jgi:hypothetical protein
VAFVSYAQPDTAKVSRNALFYADSLNKVDAFGNWSSYANLTPLCVVKYYGGRDGFIQHVQVGRMRTISEIDEAAPEMKMLHLEQRESQWQCEIRLSRYFHKESVQYHFVTYLIGQSKDDGETWRFFDVSYNSVANIIYIFPDIMDDIAIKESTIMSQEQEEKLAQQQAAAAAKPAKKAKK